MGFIDSGTLLAQDNPERLIFKFGLTSLEDVFLELCLQKSGQTIKNHDTIEEHPEEEEGEEDSGINMIVSGDRNSSSSSSMKRKRRLSMRKSAILKKKSSLKKNTSSNHAPLAVLSTANLAMSTAQPTKSVTESFHPSTKLSNSTKQSRRTENGGGLSSIEQSPVSDGQVNMNRLQSLLTKNYILFKRNPVSIILLNILPIIQIALYCISFERNPQGIPIAVVNRDNRSNSLSNVSTPCLNYFQYF